ncbi:sodium/calcium exchanger NCL2-like [Bidens hawaiensis]|uniref:sodium/calcium exchanger NCL2-like n=1 Tax=Bidens hawaiensis TaxID=980011 RepID=UPI00404B21BC
MMKTCFLFAILIGFCGKTEGATVTCELEYGFLPCTSGVWGRLFLVVVFQYLMSIGQSYISKGSDKFFSLIGPGIFGASLFHILANFPTLYIVLESNLSSDDAGVASSALMGMSILAGSAVMSVTLIWPSVIAFGSYDLEEQPQFLEEQPQFLARLTTYGVTTDRETSYTARLMLASMIPFLILQLPKIINSTSVTRVLVLITLIITLSFFFAYVVYQIFQPWIQNRRFDYVRQKYVKNKLLKLLSLNGKANVRLIKYLYKKLDNNHDGKVTKAELKTLLVGIQVQTNGELSQGFSDRIMDQLDFTGDEFIQEEEFVRVLTKWLYDARKSVAKNDYNHLRFFTKPQEDKDEEQQEPLIRKKTR